MTHGPSTRSPNYRWNSVAFVTNDACSWIALTFISVSSVLPAFVHQLTTSAPVIGLVSTVFHGGWLLPQLVAARVTSDKPRKKPYMVAGLAGRITFWVVALALWARLDRNPEAALILFFTCLGLWAVSDGVASLVAADILARTIPLNRRGRLLGLGQFIGGLGGIGVGVIVGQVLGNPSLGFPADYALLFLLAGAMFVPATLALSSVREPSAQPASRQKGGQPDGRWLMLLFADPSFRRLMACRVLVGMVDLAAPFYVGHADRILHLPQDIIGEFVIAQTVAWIAASIVLGQVSDRWGPRRVATIAGAVGALGPLFALVAQLVGKPWLVWAYPFVFMTLGVVSSAAWLGFFNYLLEIAPDSTRPEYVGLSNTILGVLTLAPVLGGWLLETTSYTALFAVTVTTVLAGCLLTLTLKPPAKPAPAQDPP